MKPNVFFTIIGSILSVSVLNNAMMCTVMLLVDMLRDAVLSFFNDNELRDTMLNDAMMSDAKLSTLC